MQIQRNVLSVAGAALLLVVVLDRAASAQMPAERPPLGGTAVVAPGTQGIDESPGVRQGMVHLSGAAAFGLSHSVSDASSETSTWALSGATGYFVLDPLSADVLATFGGNFSNDWLASLHFGATYHFLPRQQFTPYVQAAVGFTHAETELYDGFDVYSASVTEGSFLAGGGIKYFVARNVSANLGLRYEALFDYAGEGTMNYGLGLSVYFN